MQGFTGKDPDADIDLASSLTFARKKRKAAQAVARGDLAWLLADARGIEFMGRLCQRLGLGDPHSPDEGSMALANFGLELLRECAEVSPQAAQAILERCFLDVGQTFNFSQPEGA